MSDLRKAAQQALEAMLNFPDDISDEMFESIRAIRAALAQKPEPAQKPVAQAMQDAAVYGVGISRDGKRIDPASIYAQQAEPVEPYCYIYEYDGVFGLHREFYPKTYNGQKPSRTVPVYTAPPQRKPLTEEEIDAEWRKASECAGKSEGAVTTSQFVQMFARAVERAHGINHSKPE